MDAGNARKKFGEVFHVVVADFLGDVGNRLARVGEQALGFLDAHIGQVFEEVHSRLLLEQQRKIRRVETGTLTDAVQIDLLSKMTLDEFSLFLPFNLVYSRNLF